MTVGSRESNCRAPIQGVPGSGSNIWNYTHNKGGAAAEAVGLVLGRAVRAGDCLFWVVSSAFGALNRGHRWPMHSGVR